MDINNLLQFSVDKSASDLHLSTGLPPMLRIEGEIVPIKNFSPMSNATLHDMLYNIMNDSQRMEFKSRFQVDFSYEVPGLARFRVNIFNHQRGVGGVFRTIPLNVLSLEELKCPPVFKKVCEYPNGLVLVTGPTGCGKSTTLAAMIDYKNKTSAAHILTVEDPIEFVHDSKRCIVNQREVEHHTKSFSDSLRAALREDPDIILIGEMRDVETMRLAMTAAETGHLVFGTLHTSSAPKTVNRIIDVFPASDKEMVRSMLAESLRAVIAQTLVKKKNGKRVAVHEIMIGTNAIRNMRRENKVAQMYSTIQMSGPEGMQTFDQSLQFLVDHGDMSKDEARRYALNKELFKSDEDSQIGSKKGRPDLSDVLNKGARDL